jgi:hypothetical protein
MARSITPIAVSIGPFCLGAPPWYVDASVMCATELRSTHAPSTSCARTATIGILFLFFLLARASAARAVPLLPVFWGFLFFGF